MEEVDAFNSDIERQLQEEKNKVTQLATANSMYSGNQDPNLIEWQLELDNILERIEHLLAGDILTIADDGAVTYKPQPDSDLRPLNNFGVQEIMRILAIYVNRNTILSNYTAERINEILYDLGYEITDQIYINSVKFGLDTPDKEKRFPMIVIQIIHTIESAYNRAFRGGERDSLRTARIVTQSAPIGSPINQVQNMNPHKFSIFKPGTWRG